MALTPRVKKYTDYGYLVTNPPNEDAVRDQMDGAVQEVFDTVQAEVPLKTELGTLASLLTTNKTSAVAAINEVRTENRTTPTETVITSGFSAGWSGSIVCQKNQEGLKTIKIDLTKSSDILLSDSGALYTLSTEFRPKTRYVGLIPLSTAGLVPTERQLLIIDTSGVVRFAFYTTYASTNVRVIPEQTVHYY